MDTIDILEHRAVDAAVDQKWQDAVSFNLKILKLDSKNLPASLRLGFCYIQLKDVVLAKKYYLRALRIQPKNQVAVENLERIKVLEEAGGKKSTQEQAVIDPSLFLEVPGKTKSVTLVNVGQKKELAKLAVGQEVELKAKKRKVEARAKSGDYLGCLPDDLSKRLIFFLKAKSKYAAYIKEASLSKVVIFIQELGKGKRVAHYSSFPQNPHINMDQISEDAANAPADGEEETAGGDDDEWDVLTQELATEKEDIEVEIHPEEEVEE